MNVPSRQCVWVAVAFAFSAAPAAAQSGAQPGKANIERETSPSTAQAIDVLHYSLAVSLAMTNEDLRGTMGITILLDAPSSAITLNEARLELDSVLIDDVARPFTVDSNAETFTVDLGRTYNAGDTVTERIVYYRDPRANRPDARLGYYYFPDTIGLPANLGYTMSEPSDARFWMPCDDQPWDKASATIHATVPAGIVAASNGRLDSVVEVRPGEVTWYWREDHQIATYLMCVTASRFTVSTVPYVRASADTVPIQYYVWGKDSAAAAQFLPTVREMVSAYSNLFGAYPFDKYGMTAVVPFSYGGMEHQTITTLNEYLLTDEDVVCHELAHQWWGDLVTCGSWPDIWLNEGFATYCQALWHEHTGGQSALKAFMLSSEHFQHGSWEGSVYDPVSQGFNLFDDVVYSKGAWVLHMLRGVVGDSSFYQILHAYRQRFAGRSAITSDFEAVADSVTRLDLGWFFQEWLHHGGWPSYGVRTQWLGGSLSCTIEQKQSSQWQTFRMPLTLRAYLPGGGTESFVVLDSLRTQAFVLPLSASPDSVVLDPDLWVLNQAAAVAGIGGSKPLTFRMNQNYPNPFNPRTRIRYTLPDRRAVTLKVYDVLGREVATLVEETQQAGEYDVDFDGSALASGTYIYRLEAGGEKITHKMVLVK